MAGVNTPAATTPDERLQLIKQNYLDAIENEPVDLAAAKTPGEVAGVQDNLAAGRGSYFTAVASELSKNGTAIEAAYDDAKAAQASVKEAREAAEAIASLLKKLKKSTDTASNLLKKAKR